MAEIENIIKRVKSVRKNPTKEDFLALAEAFSEIVKTNENYTKYFENPDSGDSLGFFNEINLKVDKIVASYKLLFGEGEEPGVEAKVTNALKEITDSKNEISIFATELKSKIQPAIQNAQNEFDTKNAEIGALLSNMTARSLTHAYAESKGEYSVPVSKEHVKFTFKNSLKNLEVFLFNTFFRYVPVLLSYTLFILPLVGVTILFTNETTASIILGTLSRGGIVPSVWELIYVKTLVSIPLIWIAWYGQRNLSQRKRLFEEYNHKLRVVQMYIMFTSKDKYGDLADSGALEKTLLEAIKRNASEVFGRDETMLDKIAEIVLASKGIMKETVKDSASAQ